MKLAAGIILILVGGLALLIGSVVCVTTFTSDYATSACKRAAADEEKFSEARANCGSPNTDCYKQATIGLTTQEECESRTSYMRNQLLMGIVPAVLGAFIAFVGAIVAIWGFIGRRKKAVS
jgi:hypothetical protein